MPIDFNLLKTLAEHSRDVNAVAFSRDARLIVSGGGDRTVRIWDVNSYQLLHTMDHGEWVNDVAFAPSGQFVVSAARNGSVKVWTVESGKLLGTIQAHPQNATCATFSPDGTWVVSGGAEGVIRVFNLRSKSFEGSVNAHSGWVWRVAFTSKGDRLVSVGGDKVARLWLMGASSKPTVLEGHHDEVLYASFSPDDRMIVTGAKDGTMRLWDTESGQQLRSISAHEGAVNAANFSPDATLLISGGTDRTIRVWSIENGELMKELSGGYDYVAEAIFSHDGKRVISCGGDGTVKIWEVTEKSAYAPALADLEIELEESAQRAGRYVSEYAVGQRLAECSLKSGLTISLLESSPNRHALTVGNPPRPAASIWGDELAIVSGDGVPLLKIDLSNLAVTYDRTEGAAAPWAEETEPTLIENATGNAAAVEESQVRSISDEFELSDGPAQSRYQAFEKQGESLARAKNEAGRLIRLVRFDADTLYVLFDEREDPTLVIKSDLLDVRNGSKKAVFRLNLRSMQPVISRRVDAPAPDSVEPEAPRDPLLVTGADALAVSATGGPRLHRVLSKAVWAKASDIHIPSGAPILIRQHGRLKQFDERPYSPEETEAMLMEILTEEQQRRFLETNDLDFSYEIPGTGRFRANICRQYRGVDGSFRVIPDVIPSAEALGLPPAILPLTRHHQGLVLVTGPAGQGKTTTIAALVDLINGERPVHIITVEDPIEFVHPIKSAVVNQREVGKHTLSFANALRAALREDPDVIVVGEMRDLETISLAVTAAETGHLVFGTLMTISASQTVDRILDSFPAGQQAQIRTMLSESLKGIVSQQLVPTADGNSRVLACELLICNLAVANMIRERKTFQLNSVMQTSRNIGMQRMDDALFDLAQAGRITPETALMYAHDSKALEPRVKQRGGAELAIPRLH